MTKKAAWEMIVAFAIVTALWMVLTLWIPLYRLPMSRFEDGAERVFFFAFGVFSTLRRLKP